MRRLYIILATGILILTGFREAQGPSSCTIQNTAFQAGEELVYKVYYHWNLLWLNAGELNFTVRPGVIYNRSCYHFIATGATYKSYDWFFRVRDRFESFVDQQTMLPLKFIRDTDEGGYTIYENITFRHKERTAIELKDTARTPESFKIAECTQDVLSAIYYSRCIDYSRYKPGDLICMHIFIDKELFNVSIKYMGKETITVKSGTYRCIKFRPTLISGTLFKEGQEMTVWATDDANKIPVRVESPILVGSVKADLKIYKGLRHKLAGKIK